MRRREFSTLLGGAATASTVWPFAARAQPATPVIGYLGAGASGPYATAVAAFRQGLSETGYVEGQNLTIDYRWSDGLYDRLPPFAADFVGRKVDVIVADADPAAYAAKNATSTIPIVFIFGGDPVRQGLVASLAQPGGNLTGVSFLTAELIGKRFELLSELVPQVKVIAVLFGPTIPNSMRTMPAVVQEAARVKGVQFLILQASTESEIDAAFAALVQRQAGALLVSPNPFLASRREQIVALASHLSVPAISSGREFATAGGLISYGTPFTAVARQVGIYAGMILKGAKPADLPVVQPTTFELVINLKTAKAIGLTIPPSILSRADEVIE
jgi:putative tryptophan/tyrosine transport system substrate-binding protein